MTTDEAATALSLADVARLAGVRRPVVSMWRKRVVAGAPFPAPMTDGRFRADEVLDWLETTRRGNNPEARRDAALTLARSHHDAPTLDRLLTLLTVRAVTGVALAATDPEDLLDLVDEIDPDDAWLFSEAEDADSQLLRAEADTLADAAWTTADAYEELLVASRARGAARPSAAKPIEMGDALARFLSTAARALVTDHGTLIDVSGTAADALVRNDPDLPESTIVLAAHDPDSSLRGIRRRYAAHGQRPRVTAFEEDWGTPDGAVVLVTLPRDPKAAFDIADEVALQLSGRTMALLVGPASVLTDPLPRDVEGRRDTFLRPAARTLIAAVRLPQGLDRAAGREHLALWLLGSDAPEIIRVGDLSGHQPSEVWWQQLLDDIVAASRQASERAFALLQPASATTLLAAAGSLASLRLPTTEQVAAPADDAARIQQLLESLSAPTTALDGLAPTLQVDGMRRHITLAEAVRTRQIAMLAGARLAALPSGSTRVWTAGALATGLPEVVDLLALTAAYPDVKLTEPGDVIFATSGRPRAMVDAAGGAAVAYPARALRVAPGTPFSARALAATINALPPGNSKWRTWAIPLAQDADQADLVLARLDDVDAELRARQAHVDELRTLVVRSVLPGSVAFHNLRPDPMKGE